MNRLIAFLLLPVPLAAQQPKQMLAAAREVMESAQYCFLVTVDGAGEPRARLMQQFPPGPDMTVWMGANPKSRKVEQIRANPRAALACYDPKGPGYLSLTGRARLVDSVEERRKRWRPDWEQFFPSGPAGANYVLIEFVPSRLELISPPHKIGITPDALRPPALERKGGGWVTAP